MIDYRGDIVDRLQSIDYRKINYGEQITETEIQRMDSVCMLENRMQETEDRIQKIENMIEENSRI